jgi:pimeloyl-ACP methyl ester carboxylesterase
MPGRRVADAAGDVRAVADQLGVDRFCVVGRSGGGPHALACAALLPDRVMRAAVLVGLAPADAVGLDWYDGMSADNARNHANAEVGDAELMREMIALAVRTAADPESLLDELRTQAAEPDLRFMQSVMYRRMLTAGYAEALRVGPLATLRGWTAGCWPNRDWPRIMTWRWAARADSRSSQSTANRVVSSVRSPSRCWPRRSRSRSSALT